MNEVFEQFQIPSKLLQFQHGDEIFRLGQKTDALYLVKQGQVQLFRDDLHGNRIILHQAFSHQFFAEASINSNHYHCTAQCIGDSELFQIMIDDFNLLLQNNMQFSHVWIKHLATELRRQRASVERLSLKTAAEKIIHFITTEGDKQGRLELNSSLSDIAQIIGLSRESLYRTLTKMKKNQQIKQSDNYLQLL